MTTVGEVVSRVKEVIKAYKQDSFVTDRLVYSIILKHGKLLMRRQDAANKIMKFNPVFQTLDYVELDEIDKVDAACRGLSSDCTIKRTKLVLPTFMEGYYGPLIRSVMSVDGSEEMQPIYPATFVNLSRQKNFKYNNTKYFWFLNGYLYCPNVEWDAIKVEGVFEDDISKFNCDCNDLCLPMQDTSFNIPDYLHSEIEQMVYREFGINMQTPPDNAEDKQSIYR